MKLNVKNKNLAENKGEATGLGGHSFRKKALLMGFTVVFSVALVGCGNNQKEETGEILEDNNGSAVVLEDQSASPPGSPVDSPVVPKEEPPQVIPEKQPTAEKPTKPTTQKPASPSKPKPVKPAAPSEPTPEKPAEITLSAGDLLAKVLVDVETISGMESMGSEQITDLFGVDTSKLDSYSVKINMMNINATEIGVFRVKDSKDVKLVKGGIEAHVKTKIDGWMPGYMPDEITKMENYTIKSKGNYVMYAIADEEDKTKIFKAFDAVFQ